MVPCAVQVYRAVEALLRDIADGKTYIPPSVVQGSAWVARSALRMVDESERGASWLTGVVAEAWKVAERSEVSARSREESSSRAP